MLFPNLIPDRSPRKQIDLVPNLDLKGNQHITLRVAMFQREAASLASTDAIRSIPHRLVPVRPTYLEWEREVGGLKTAIQWGLKLGKESDYP